MLCHPKSPASRTFLKYAGGKSRLLNQLLPLLPLGARLIEPFVGAGSVFLAADYDSYLINDSNPDLVAVWVALKQRPREFIETAATLFIPENDTPETFYRIRQEFNTAIDRFERAVRLPYLNRFGFNGLYRVNSRGEFNVPFGRRAAIPRFPWDEMAVASEKLKRCVVTNSDFSAPFEEAESSDVVYCDPPYVSVKTTKSFTGYTQGGFGEDDQRRLVELAHEAASRRATVVISNHDTPEARSLYTGFELHTFDVRRSLAANADARGLVKELVAILRP